MAKRCQLIMNLRRLFFACLLLLLFSCTKRENTPSLLARLSYDLNGEHIEYTQYTTGDSYWDALTPIGIGEYKVYGIETKQGRPVSVDYSKLCISYRYWDSLYIYVPGNGNGPFIENYQYGLQDGIDVCYNVDYPDAVIIILEARISFEYTKYKKASQSGRFHIHFDFTETVSLKEESTITVDTISIANGVYTQFYSDDWVNLVLR